MARAFDVATKAPRFELPELTRQQIQALILDLELDAREVVIRAVAELWQREMGEPDRDVWSEIDELKQQVAALQPQKDKNMSEAIGLTYDGKYVFDRFQDAPNRLYSWCVPIRAMEYAERQAFGHALRAYERGEQTAEDVMLLRTEMPDVGWTTKA